MAMVTKIYRPTHFMFHETNKATLNFRPRLNLKFSSMLANLTDCLRTTTTISSLLNCIFSLIQFMLTLILMPSD